MTDKLPQLSALTFIGKGTGTRPVPGMEQFPEVRLNPCWRQPTPLVPAAVPPCRHLRRQR